MCYGPIYEVIWIVRVFSRNFFPLVPGAQKLLFKVSQSNLL